MKNIESFLKKIGVKSAIITTLTSTDELDAEKMDELVSTHQNTVRETLKNDPEFINPLQDSITGAERSKIEHKIKKVFGLTAEEMKDKKMDEIMALAVDKIKSQHTGTAEELQIKLTDLAKENKRLLEEVIPAKEQEATGKIKSYKKDLKIREKLAARELTVKPSIILPALNGILDGEFDIDIDDKDEFTIKTKDGLNPLSKDKTKVLTFDDILDAKLLELEVLKQSKAPTPGTPSPTPGGAGPRFEPPTPGKFNLPGLDRAKANETEMAKIRTFGQ